MKSGAVVCGHPNTRIEASFACEFRSGQPGFVRKVENQRREARLARESSLVNHTCFELFNTV